MDSKGTAKAVQSLRTAWLYCLEALNIDENLEELRWPLLLFFCTIKTHCNSLRNEKTRTNELVATNQTIAALFVRDLARASRDVLLYCRRISFQNITGRERLIRTRLIRSST